MKTGVPADRIKKHASIRSHNRGRIDTVTIKMSKRARHEDWLFPLPQHSIWLVKINVEPTNVGPVLVVTTGKEHSIH
jgi:hypothetical protein